MFNCQSLVNHFRRDERVASQSDRFCPDGADDLAADVDALRRDLAGNSPAQPDYQLGALNLAVDLSFDMNDAVTDNLAGNAEFRRDYRRQLTRTRRIVTAPLVAFMNHARTPRDWAFVVLCIAWY